MSEEQWKLEQDLCRCCLNEGSFKNLAEPCLNQGEEEIYSEMLLESLDINITPVSGPLCNSTYTICEECVLRLRDACSFKRQVLLSEKRFRELYRRDVIKLHSTSLDVKQEVPDSDNEDGDPVKMEMDQNEDDDDFRISYEHDDDSKSNIEIEIQEEKKTKPRKPKAKEKPKPKKKAGRPRKVKAEADAEADDDTKDKKDIAKGTGDADYTVKDFGTETFVCNICFRTIRRRHRMKKHLTNVHGLAIIKHPEKEYIKHVCKICSKECSSKNGLTNHVRVHDAKKMELSETEGKYFICYICSAIFKSKQDVEKHLRNHGFLSRPNVLVAADPSTDYTIVDELPRKKYICNICSRSFKHLISLKHHLIKLHEIDKAKIRHPPKKLKRRKYVCDICSKEFLQKSYLVQHLMTHTPSGAHSVPNKNVCSICQKQVAKMYLHLRGHGIFKCEPCKTQFKDIKEWSSHQREAHGKQTHGGKKLECEACGVVIVGRMRKLISHLRTHNIFKCAICFNAFDNKNKLIVHRRVDHPAPLFSCGACDYKTQKRCVLAMHQRNVHMKERTVPCPHCDEMFFSNSAKNMHMVRHNPVKKYECKYCKKKFPRLETLRRHERIHTGEKNKVCKICDMRFVQKASLSYHMKKYHPEAV